ncbi:MAG TPA: hypothetical protein VGR37_19870, partial [Longimicrobiaceae bacterium]|nr:hypothetical protein [Longimicrobiaceae bacterium]
AARAPVPSLAPCFKDPAEGEVVAGGRKLVGSAQVREAGVLLQHGSLLLEGDQREVREWARGEAPVGGEAPPATLAELCGSVPCWERLTAALAAGWEEATGTTLLPGGLTPEEGERAERLRARFAGAAWTWHK